MVKTAETTTKTATAAPAGEVGADVVSGALTPAPSAPTASAAPAPSAPASRDYPRPNLHNSSVWNILWAAADCFARNGYQGTSTKEIALRAGVSKSLLHYHFESKEHILIELQRMITETAFTRLGNVSLQKEPSIENALDTLDEAWKLLKGVRRYLTVVTDLWNLAMTQDALRVDQKKLYGEILGMLVSVIRQCLGPDADSLSIPPARLANLLISAMPGIALRLQVDPVGAQEAYEDFKRVLVSLAAPELESLREGRRAKE